LEEIYFPKISDFVEVTDGKCTEEQMFEIEIQIVMKLQWLMNPTTLNGWLNIFMMKWDSYVTQLDSERLIRQS
jgi:cyclin E